MQSLWGVFRANYLMVVSCALFTQAVPLSAFGMPLDVVTVAPPSWQRGQSYITQAVGITDSGVVVGNAYMNGGVFVFDGTRFGFLQLSGSYNFNNPQVTAVSTDGWVFGTGFAAAEYCSWALNLAQADWQMVGGSYILSFANSGYIPPPTNYLVNDVSGISDQDYEFLRRNNLTAVAMNASGQIIANGQYGLGPDLPHTLSEPLGSNIAYLLNPASPVPEPPSGVLMLTGLLGLIVLTQKINNLRRTPPTTRSSNFPHIAEQIA